ncbi:threonine dehydratase [Varunaivibrio sulfuroxidans]|uniref:Threonine dehydratase n=1 Tax=Varunaivibrio sulfuroxidans TaxID=1773489 RepID=A0A4R3JBS0_9PROT|nr:threonine dehydratase [Varunaivibrio sulfuroxidans]TCS63162.1 threonine dehydratase [Varunaivibrio sulfuroxidans]WES31776.1 threonine dehydratase [Varunaivibrio sulfuroxidans]
MSTFDLNLDAIEKAGADIYRHMSPTAQYRWPLLSRRCGCDVWVKHENHTPVGAFKVRGGLAYMAELARRQPNLPGVVSATRGNHGQSLAFASAKVGKNATIVVPHGNDSEKNAAMRALGAELIEHGADFQEALEFAGTLAERRGLYPIGPFEEQLIRGVATYALEFFGAVSDLDTVYVPIGMGSGICGLIAVRDALGLKTEIVGVVSEQAPAYALSFEAGRAIPGAETVETIADGVACRVPNPDAVAMIVKGAARVIRVGDDAIRAAMAAYFSDTHNVAEGAGAIPLAGLMVEKEKMAGRKVGLILSGANVSRKTFADVLSSVA